MMERLTGIPEYGQANILGLVGTYCKRQDYPKLTSIVVSEKSGLPVPEMNLDNVGLMTEHTRVFVFPWLDKKAPSTEDFESSST
jgi:hypothetical protein